MNGIVPEHRALPIRGRLEMTVRIRTAGPHDVDALTALIHSSARALQSSDYGEAQIEGALGSVFGVDTTLIADGSYFVAEDLRNLAGCGGWSRRKTLFGADAWLSRNEELLDPATDRAKIRALFVHPTYARRGVGTALLSACEDAARAAGFTRFELGATLTGERLFAAHGYRPAELRDVDLPNGAVLPIVVMTKG
jgi:GNAT superfamily N-acetyltransferase